MLQTAALLLLLVTAAPADDTLKNVVTVSDESTYSKYPAIAFGRDGQRWMAWTTTREGKDQIIFRSGSGAEERVDRGDGLESGAALVATAAGEPLIAYHGRRKGAWGVYARERRNGRWSEEVRVAANALHPSVARDSAGVLWVAYEIPKASGFAIGLAKRSGRTWREVSRIESSGTDRRPVLAAAANGGVWLVWDSTRSGNYDVWIAHSSRMGSPLQVTSDPTIDDSPSLAVAKDGAVWIAWNGMRGHSDANYPADRNSGDAFVRVLRNGVLHAPPGVTPSALSGQVCFGAVTKSVRDAVDPYWHWKQTQNYPIVALDGDGRAWIIWRTDATGAHNFDLWARVHDGSRWSRELHLTTFSPGRDEWPAAAVSPDGVLHLAWEGQVLPKPGEEAKFLGGDVDAYNTLGLPNVILSATATAPDQWSDAPIAAAPPDRSAVAGAARAAGPKTADGKWSILFGDPHSHSILSDGKTGLPDQILQVSRDDLALDFAVVSDHAEMGLLQPAEYAELQLTARVFDQAGRFVSLTGWEWTAGSRFGHRVILYRDEGGLPVSWARPESDTIEELYDHVRKDHGVMSPHHTGHATWGRWNPDAHHDEELEPNFEVASWHGRFEFYGNPYEGRRQVPGHQYQDALRRGRHVGAMGASDTHHLTPGEGGLTAVLAERADRASVFDAIRARRNYATSGAKIILEFTAGGAPMGSRITHEGPLQMTVRVEGTAIVDRVEIVRNLVDTFALVRIEQNPSGRDGVYVLYEPRAPQAVNLIRSTDTRAVTFSLTDVDEPKGETSYYVRVTQADGHQAWSSPVWVTRR
jgi:hypothetical protein